MAERTIISRAFEVFLKNTNEKTTSAVALSELIATYLETRSQGQKVSILDIGAGTGVLTELLMGMLPEDGPEMGLTLLEPNPSYVESLRERTYKGVASPIIVTDSWESSSLQEQYDIIIASHLYHLKDEIYEASLYKMLSALNPDGVLFFVFRNEDDVFAFKAAIRPLIGLPFERNSAQKFLAFFQALPNPPLSISTTDVESTLNLPEETEELRSIIEFLLTISWKALTTEQQLDILGYLLSLKHHNKMTMSEKIIAVRFAPRSKNDTLIE